MDRRDCCRCLALCLLPLGHGAAPSLPDREGVTPLAHARQRGQTPIVEMLQRAGAR